MQTYPRSRSFLQTLLSVLVISVLIASLVTACSSGGQKTPAATVVQSKATLAPSDTPQPTSSPTSTSTPTPAPTATATATLAPTPTPPGFFSLDSAGFSLTYPTSWEIEEQSSRHVVLVDSTGLVMILESAAEKDPVTMTEFIEQMKGIFTESGAQVDVVNSNGMALLADRINARKVEMVVKGAKNTLDVWALQAYHSRRTYTILIYARKGTMQTRETTLSEVLGSMTLFTPRPFGLDRKETLTLVGGDPEGKDLDPATTTSSAEDYVGLLFSGLVRLSPDLQIVPALAEKWTISPDGLVYTFILREGIQFASGDSITAQTVKASWERACDPETESTTASTYLGDILGAKNMLDGKAKELSGVKVIDDRTLEVTLDGLKPYFLAKLTYPTSYVVDTEQVKIDPKTWMFEANSSGPYRIKEYAEKDRLIFERNDRYFAPPAVPYIAYMLDPGGPDLSLYEEGTVDIAYLSYDEVQEIIKPDHKLNKQLLTTPSMCTTLLQINPSKAPLDDLNVRMALMLATDRAEFVKQLTNDAAIVANGVLPPAMPGYQADRELMSFDPVAAKDALAASKYAGQALTITISASGYGDTQRKDVALLVDMWQKNLGVKVKVEYVDPANFSEASRKNAANVVVYGWCADYPDPENFLDVLYHTGSRMNVANASDVELDKILEDARKEPDTAKRLDLYKQAEERILNQVLSIPLLTSQRGVVVNPRVKNYILSPLNAGVLPLLALEEEK